VKIPCQLSVHLFDKSDTFVERKKKSVQSLIRLTTDNWFFGNIHAQYVQHDLLIFLESQLSQLTSLSDHSKLFCGLFWCFVFWLYLRNFIRKWKNFIQYNIIFFYFASCLSCFKHAYFFPISHKLTPKIYQKSNLTECIN
jgi:hypothetical protein